MSPDADDPDFGSLWDRLQHDENVPRPFFSEYLTAPFIRCIDCDAELIETGAAHSVIKSYVAGEAVFEMAICVRCSLRLAEGYSDHSKAAFEAAMRGWKSRQQPRSPAPPSTPAIPLARGDIDGIEHCAGCGRERRACHRYSIVGTFLGRGLISPVDAPLRLPLMICDACNNATTENISVQTRDNWDRFVEEHFDGPPRVEVDTPRMDPILI